MADFLAQIPLGQILPAGVYGAPGTAGIALSQRSSQAATLVAGRDRAALAAAVQAAFAVSPTDAPERTAGAEIEFVGVGPGRWLVLSPSDGLRQRLEAAIGGLGSVFEQSGGLVVLEAKGPALPSFLAKLVALDLDPRAFPSRAAATTDVAHINVTLWRPTPDVVVFALGASFLAAFLRAVATAAAEYGLDWRGKNEG